MSACSLLPFNATEMNALFDSNVASGDERRHLLPTSNLANRVIALPLDASRMLSVQHDAFRLVDPACLVRLPSSEFRVGDNIEFVCFASPGRGTSSESHFNIAFLVRVASFAHLLKAIQFTFDAVYACFHYFCATPDNIGQITGFSHSAHGIILMHIQLYLNHSEIACHCGFSTHSEKEVFLSQQTRQVPATYLRRHIAVLSMQQFCSAYSHQLPSVSSEPELEAPLEPIAKLSLQDAAQKILRESEYLCRFHVDSHSIMLPRHNHNSSGDRNRECVQLGASSLDLLTKSFPLHDPHSYRALNGLFACRL
jgi:hypothetical protein